MPVYSLNLNNAHRELRSDHLRLGGENRLGETVGVTNQYLTRNGRPFFGISGEFQFSRYPAEYWEEELLKIKAGGINTVATYVFWIHHEQQPGVFDWSGQRNLRRFVELCAKHGFWVIARVGPFAHGECRNGGLPDWLYGQSYPVRSNDPGYLAVVERYFNQVGNQLQGLFFQDGGPVVCVQLENEYEHTGAPWDIADRNAPVEWLPRGSDGVEHMQRLKALAEQAGLAAPLYTATGWGSPVIEDEMLPVHGGYAYPVWVENPGPSDLFLFYDRQTQPHPDVRYRLGYHYPLLNAEMQGGIQIRYGNRPVVPPRSTEALALVQVGCGSNFLGYYIYHGGSNPMQHTGYTNEILHPQVSYDFQAPIGEYGEVRDSYRGLKLVHTFLQSFGERLAVMPPVFPQGSQDIDPGDPHTLRFAGRAKDGEGFLFLNNFQDHLKTQPIPGIHFRLELGQETIELPHQGELTLQPEVSCIFPLNLPMPGARLVYATAQPLTVIETEEETHYFFFAPEGIQPEYCLVFESGPSEAPEIIRPQAGIRSSGDDKACTFSYTAAGTQRQVRITTLDRWEAEHAWRGVAWGQDRLIVSEADLVFSNGGVELHAMGQEDPQLWVFPPLASAPTAQGAPLRCETGSLFSTVSVDIPPSNAEVIVDHRGPEKALLRFPREIMQGVNDLFLSVDYTGDIAGAYINGRLVADHYNNGTPWRMGLKRFLPALFEHGLVLAFRPLRKGTIKNVSNAMAARMEFEGETRLEVHSIECTPEYVVRLA